jgi:heavy metal sensor kinase
VSSIYTWWRSHNVRVRLTLWYATAMIVVLAVYAAGVYAFVSHNVSATLDERLRNDYFWVASTVDEGPDGMIMPVPQVDLLLENEQPWVQVWTADGVLMLLSNEEARRRPIPDAQTLAQKGGDRSESFIAGTVPVRVLSRPSYIRNRRVVIQVARSELPMRESLRDLAAILILGLPMAVAIAGLGGYSLARQALAPIENMSDRARHITAENLGERLPIHNPDDEMGRMASVFNETLGRLEASFEQMRRFTADVSHELRTPLTAIRSVGEVGLRGHRSESEYRGIIGSMLEEVDRLAGLVDRLLTLSRAATGQASLSRDVIDLATLADDVVTHLGVLAEEKRQQIVVERRAAPLVPADRLVLRQALINLVDNAIKFSPSGGSVRIRVAESAERATVDVIDSGPGVSTEARDRIFDRFYRQGDAPAAGTGLGLSLAKGGIEAIGGQLTLEASGAGGSTFRISLPRVDAVPSSTFEVRRSPERRTGT